MTASDRPWLASYPASVAPEIDSDHPACVSDLLVSATERFASRTAFACGEYEISFGRLNRLSKRISDWLQSLGVAEGARVAIMMPNILHQPVCALAVLRSGLVCVNVNPFYTPFELEHQLRDSGAEILFVADDCLTVVEQLSDASLLKRIVVTSASEFAEMAGQTGIETELSPQPTTIGNADRTAFASIIRSDWSSERDVASPLPDSPALLQYTGGTTGVSKGATLSHSNLSANLAQYRMWLESVFVELDGRQPVFLCAMPLYHISAFTLGFLFGLLNGFLVVLIPNPRDIESIFDVFEQRQVNMFPAVNTMYAAMNAHPRMLQTDFSGLMLSISGGAAAHRAVAERWQELTGSTVLEGYGMSETSPIISVNRPDCKTFSGHVGYPVPSTHVIALDDDGNVLPMGAAGEIAVRGPQVMQGYWRRPDETSLAFTSDGYFKTGDIGVIEPDGAIRLIERKKDMILVSGFNVYPNEIEAAVSACPGVLECAAIGVSDERSGEAVKLFVVRSDPAVKDTDIQSFCRSRLAAYKRPKLIEFRDDLPKSAVGKILRRALR